MTNKTKAIAALLTTTVAAPLVLMGTSQASDHADTPDIARNPGTDLTDVYIFPSGTNPDNVVLAMNVNPLIPPGGTARFDPNVLYQFKIDNSGDYVEDLVLQFRFRNTGNGQHYAFVPPTAPSMTGTQSVLEAPRIWMPTTNKVVASSKYKLFAGVREDPFFFDLEQFFNILPDRATPLTGVPVSNPNEPQATSWRAPGEAVDFLSNGGYNVLTIVVEIPRNMLRQRRADGTMVASNGLISVWCTTSVPSDGKFVQMDRLARPAVNEVFATVANDRHEVNDEIAPTQDASELANDIESFMTFPAGRSQAIRNVVNAVLVPDVLKADLRSMDRASYLGYETGGATGGKFGGRALTDDVVDISLGVIFGNTVPALGLAPDDGNEIPSLISDNVGPDGKHFLQLFPYLGEPR